MDTECILLLSSIILSKTKSLLIHALLSSIVSHQIATSQGNLYYFVKLSFDFTPGLRENVIQGMKNMVLKQQ